MQFTPPVQVVYALKQAIEEFFAEGGTEKRYARYETNWRTLREGLKNLGFQFLLKPENESRVLLSVIEPESDHYDFEILHDKLYKKGFTIYPGKIEGRNTFRVANIGAIYENDIKNFLDCLSDVLDEMNIVLT
jgi:2-aminoethylphosphonate-pyruvate transaminase